MRFLPENAQRWKFEFCDAGRSLLLITEKEYKKAKKRLLKFNDSTNQLLNEVYNKGEHHETKSIFYYPFGM